METITKVLLPLPNKKKVMLECGLATTEEEKEEMFRLRYKIYVERNKYISKESIPGEQKEIDNYDKDGHCLYFIAKIDKEIIGTVRVIRKDPLPIQKNYYEFEEPVQLKDFLPAQKIELGRLISTGHYQDAPLPRHIVMVSLFWAVTIFAGQNNIAGGYGAIKQKILFKLKFLKFPLYLIANYKLIFSVGNDDPLDNFFNPNDPVIPIYFLREELEKFFNIFFGSQILFRQRENSIKEFRPGYWRLFLFSILHN